MTPDKHKKDSTALAVATGSAPVGITDTERLNFLQKSDAETFSDEGFGDGEAVWQCTVGSGNRNDRRYVCYGGSTIREAIDAAMRAPNH
jgi:hypothetical protein